jgi:hypothetical protein
MNIKQLEKAKAVYERIKEIDAEIIKLNKAVQKFHGRVKLTLSMEQETAAPKPPNVFDAYGFIKPEFQDRAEQHESMNPLQRLSNYFNNRDGSPLYPESPTVDLTKYISDSMAYEIFAIVLRDLNDQRKTLLLELEKMGIQI